MTATNPHDEPILIMRIEVTVHSAGGCPASSIVIPAYDAAMAGVATHIVPANGSVEVPMTAMLRNLPTNQDSCKGAAFALNFHGQARQWLG